MRSTGYPHSRSVTVSAALIVAAGSAGALFGASPATPPATTGTAPDTVVRLAKIPKHRQAASVVQEWAIGSLEGPEEKSFGSIAAVAVDASNRLYVVDDKAPAVRVFDSTGRHVMTIGRRGRGPGEFERPGEVGFLPDGRLVVADPFGSRLNLYSPDGRSSATWLVPGMAISFVPRSMVIDRHGVAWVLSTTRRTAIDRAPGSRSFNYAIIRVYQGKILDTVPDLRVPARDGTDPAMMRAQSRAGSREMRVPFAPAQLAALSPRGYWITGTNARYAFEMLIPTSTPNAPRARFAPWRTGDRVVSVRGPDIPAVPVDPEESRDYRRSIEEVMRGTDPQWRWGGPPIPVVKPVYRRLFVDQDGRIWVRLHTRATRIPGTHRLPAFSAWPEEPVWDLFDPDGDYLGRIRFGTGAFGAEPVAAKGSRIWTKAVSEDGAPIVRQLAIRWTD